jgi:protein-tyrosine kinase
MKEIREAIERARSAAAAGPKRDERQTRSQPRLDSRTASLPTTVDAPSQRIELEAAPIELNARHLLSKRVIAHNRMEMQATAFDMLRTQVLQSMDVKSWNIIGITSPTPGCGKTVTAVNLALSIARQAERSVLLVDLDLHKPQVANSLGFKPRAGVLSVLEGRLRLMEATTNVQIGEYGMVVLPTEAPTPGLSDLMASQPMTDMMQKIKQNYRSHIVVVDLPPLLSSDDVLAILPQLDCLLLVAAIGTTTIADINESNKHLQAAEIVRVVLNKVPASANNYYYY